MVKDEDEAEGVAEGGAKAAQEEKPSKENPR